MPGELLHYTPAEKLSLHALTAVNNARQDIADLMDTCNIASFSTALNLSPEAGMVIGSRLLSRIAIEHGQSTGNQNVIDELTTKAENNDANMLDLLKNTELANMDSDLFNSHNNLLTKITIVLHEGISHARKTLIPENQKASKYVAFKDARTTASSYQNSIRDRLWLTKVVSQIQLERKKVHAAIREAEELVRPQPKQPPSNEKETKRSNSSSTLEAHMREHPHLTSAMTGLLLLASMFGINTTMHALDHSATIQQQSIAGITMPPIYPIISSSSTPQPEKSSDTVDWNKFQQLMKEYGYVVRPTTPTEPRSALAGTEGNYVRSVPLADNSNIFSKLGIPGYIDSTEAGKEIRWEGEIDIEIPTKPGEKRKIDRYGIIPGNPNMYVRIARFYEDGTWEPYVEFKIQSPKNQK